MPYLIIFVCSSGNYSECTMYTLLILHEKSKQYSLDGLHFSSMNLTGSEVAICKNCQRSLRLDRSLLTPKHRGDIAIPKCNDPSKPNIKGRESGRPENLFDIIINSASPLEGPMCQGCADQLLFEMDRHLKELEEECSDCQKFLTSLQNRRENIHFEAKIYGEKLERMKKEEAALVEELDRLMKEEESLKRDLDEITVKKNDSEKEERGKWWKKFRDNHRLLLDLDNEEQNKASQLLYGRNLLEKLTSINVVNKAFQIWVSDSFCTINGFRLGRLPNALIEWNEINAAWGQISLLFLILAKSCSGFQLHNYEVIPMGSHSFIRNLGTGVKLPLYGSGPFKTAKETEFDKGMCAFVDCLCQLQKYLETKGELRLPYRMNCDRGNASFEYKSESSVKIEYSVKNYLNSPERWTGAMKCLLTNLKWMYTYILCDRKRISQPKNVPECS
ncbi:hypothetical protein AB6A40_001309 [Gnathostoma spinigerum]|uniref:Uncharacterized protein n=1 Tax=Gnathostoma spinigerum TaxID=75299 RepID=A0ABD6E3W7_9BILA